MKAVILDYDGVMVDSAQANEKRSKRVAALFKEQWSPEFKDLWKNQYLQLTEGKLTLGEYYSKIAQVVGKPVTGAEDTEYMKGEQIRDKEIGNQISEIKKAHPSKVKFAILGNYVGRWAEHVMDHLNISRNFSALVFSDKIKVRMPDAESYQAVMEKLGVHAKDCIFVSHIASHLEGAQSIGMTVVYLGDIEAAAEGFQVIPNILEVQKYL